VARFDRLVGDGRAAALEQAISLYHVDLLDGFGVDEPPFEDWLQVERERLRSRAVVALKKLLSHHVGENLVDAAVQAAIRLLAFEPFAEDVHRTLMRLYADSGRRSAALRQYEECVEILSRELGSEPEAKTRELYRSLVPDRIRPTSIAPPTDRHRRSTPHTDNLQHTFTSIAQAPLVGRTVDIEWLDAVRESALKGQSQQLLIIGEAGIGKSRLVEELAVRTRRHRGDVLLGRGREGESVLPFAPWVEALRPILSEDLVESLPLAIRRDLGRLFSEIDDAPSAPSGWLEDGPRIFEAIAHLLRRLSAERQLTVVIEDLHWCDDMTVRLFRFLPRRLEGRRLLLVGTARSEEMSGDSGRSAVLDVLAQDTTCILRTLGPLSRDEATQLFRALLATRDEAPSALLIENTWRLSEGNPFVVVECARAARDRSAAGPDNLPELPNQVRALTARAFARLSERAVRLVDVAAVIGRDFHAALLRQATGLADWEVADGVEELVRRHILREMNGRFDFRHDRIREVAYIRLLTPRRALLHREVAQALEATYAVDLASHLTAIGTHYRHAECWQQACDYLARSGFQAWNRGAGREALTCFEDALQAIAQLRDTDAKRALHVHLLLAANGAHAAVGSYERGRPHLLAAQHLASTLSDRRWAGRVAVALGNSYRTHSSLTEAIRLAQFALEVAQDTGDGGLESAARFVLAHSEATVAKFRSSLSHMAALLSSDAQCPDLDGPFLHFVATPTLMRAHARWMSVLNYLNLGEFDAAMRTIADSLHEADTLSDPLGTSRMLANLCLGKVETARGNFDASVRAFETALGAYKEDYHRNYYRPLGWGLGLAYVLAGRVEEGLRLLERGEATEREIGSMTYRPMLLLHFGRALLAAGRLDDATQAASGALRRAREVGNRISEAGAHGLLGEVAWLRTPADLEAMEHHVLDALALAEPLEMRPLIARCHLRLAWLYEKSGRREYATHAAAAAQLLEQMGNPTSLDAAAVH
jgi:predicted ATPase